MNHRLLVGAYLALVTFALLQASAASSTTLVKAQGPYAGSLTSKAAPSCEPPARKPARYVGEWRFLPSRSGEVSGDFGRLSWSGPMVEFRIAAGFVVDVCASTRGGGMQYSESHSAVGPRDGRINLGDRIAMVGFGVVRSVPFSITSGL